MVQIEAISTQNLLQITFSGKIIVGQIKASMPSVEMEVAKLKPEFQIITNMTDLESMTHLCAPEVQQYMNYFKKSGVGRVVRVIPDPLKDIGFNLMSIFHYGPSMRIATCTCLEEATKLLPS